jgi:hypothetical protein
VIDRSSKISLGLQPFLDRVHESIQGAKTFQLLRAIEFG